MNNLFSNHLDVYIMIYLYNILIFSNNISVYCWHIKKVLKYFCKTGLCAKIEKYKFYSELVKYLGYILSPPGLTMSNDKVKIIQDWSKPKKAKDIQSFLGFANFYYWFILNYLNIIISLTHIIWKDISWKFNSSCYNTFNFLKKAFIFTPILIYWISNGQLIVKTDVSNYAFATIFPIINEQNKFYLVVFHSYTFTIAELNYDIHD